MQYFLTEDQIVLRNMCREFAEKELKPIAAEYDRKGEFPMHVYKKIVDMGIHCMEIPEEYGGPGLDYITVAIMREELAKGDAGFNVTLGANNLGFKPLVVAGTEEQKRHFADVVIPGGFACFCLTEPGAGSDAGACRTTATKVGDEYIINGRKCFITNGGLANIMTVVASTDRSSGVKGLSMFLVDADTPGVSVGKEEDKMGLRLSNTCDMIFEDVHVPAKNLIGKEGQGFKIAMKVLDRGRVGAAAVAVGIAQAAFEEAVKYAKQRITFGKPIIDNQAISFMLADMETQIQAARQLVMYACKIIDSETPDSKIGAMAKCFASDVAMRVTTDAVQVLGGYGYMRDYPVEKLMRDAKIFQLFEGTNQIQRMVIGNNIKKEY